MAVYRYEVEIGDDHQVTLPKEVPVGRAEIIVTPQRFPNYDWEKLQKAIDKVSTGPHHVKNKEDVDAYVRHERESWE